MKNTIKIVLIATLFWACAQSGPKIRDITELFPPKNVRIYADNEGYRVVWDESIDQDHPNFAGYNIYYGPKSLVMASVEDLPAPIFVAKPQNEFTLPDLGRDGQHFIHVRSCDTKGHLSLPSLPELIINPSATF